MNRRCACILLACIAACHAHADAGDDGAGGASPSADAVPAPAGPPGAAPGGDAAAPPDGSPPAPPLVDPEAFAPGEVDVVSEIHSDRERRPISPLVYGINSAAPGVIPSDVLAAVTFVRRGGDRCNTYDWETNVSNGGPKGNWVNDMFLARALANPNAPGELDRTLIADDVAGGRGTLVPFVLHSWVAGPVTNDIPYTTPGWPIDQYFRRVDLVKPTPFAATPDTTDGVVYTDEQLDFLRRQFPGDVFAPGPTQVMVGADNEPDLYAFNYPMLQRGSGPPVTMNGTTVGNAITGAEFTDRFVTFAKRVRQLEPSATIVGPDHYNYDGWTTFHEPGPPYDDNGRWYMDDFLASVRAASGASGTRLLDVWDFHWYPQRVFDGTFTWSLDDAARRMTADEIEEVLQGPRSYWDPDYDELSWITTDHLHAPAMMLKRLQDHVATAYAGTDLGVTEYFPGGCAHVSSGLAVVDSLGVFGRMGVRLAAMWPHTCDLRFAFAGLLLARNADGAGLRFDATSVAVDHPEKEESSVYAASDGPPRVTVLVVNKTNAPRRFGIRLFHPALAGVEVRAIDASHDHPFLVAHEALAKRNAYAYTTPAMSAALLVFRADPW
ncbi:MAG TPA: glycoside hydrolase family 44 protein [Labilithrix sp.]